MQTSTTHHGPLTEALLAGNIQAAYKHIFEDQLDSEDMMIALKLAIHFQCYDLAALMASLSAPLDEVVLPVEVISIKQESFLRHLFFSIRDGKAMALTLAEKIEALDNLPIAADSLKSLMSVAVIHRQWAVLKALLAHPFFQDLNQWQLAYPCRPLLYWLILYAEEANDDYQSILERAQQVPEAQVLANAFLFLDGYYPQREKYFPQLLRSACALDAYGDEEMLGAEGVVLLGATARVMLSSFSKEERQEKLKAAWHRFDFLLLNASLEKVQHSDSWHMEWLSCGNFYWSLYGNMSSEEFGRMLHLHQSKFSLCFGSPSVFLHDLANRERCFNEAYSSLGEVQLASLLVRYLSAKHHWQLPEELTLVQLSEVNDLSYFNQCLVHSYARRFDLSFDVTELVTLDQQIDEGPALCIAHRQYRDLSLAHDELRLDAQQYLFNSPALVRRHLRWAQLLTAIGANVMMISFVVSFLSGVIYAAKTNVRQDLAGAETAKKVALISLMTFFLGFALCLPYFVMLLFKAFRGNSDYRLLEEGYQFSEYMEKKHQFFLSKFDRGDDLFRDMQASLVMLRGEAMRRLQESSSEEEVPENTALQTYHDFVEGFCELAHDARWHSRKSVLFVGEGLLAVILWFTGVSFISTIVSLICWGEASGKYPTMVHRSRWAAVVSAIALVVLGLFLYLLNAYITVMNRNPVPFTPEMQDRHSDWLSSYNQNGSFFDRVNKEVISPQLGHVEQTYPPFEVVKADSDVVPEGEEATQIEMRDGYQPLR